MTIKKENPHTIKEGEIQITSNADIESIVSQCSAPEFPKALENKNFGTPPYPSTFYKEYYGSSFETNGTKDSNKLPLWIYVNKMYDAGYKADEAEKFIETQCNTIKNNITETFKNIQNFSKPEVDTICDKWPIDDSYLIRKSCRGSFIYTYILQQLFVESMLEWNLIIEQQVDKICNILKSSSSSGKPDLLISAGWFDSNATDFSFNGSKDKDKVKKALGCLDSKLATEIVDKYISGNLDSIKIGKDTRQAQLIKAATSDSDDNIYNECTKRNKELVEKVKEDLYGTTFSDGKLENELKAIIKRIENTFWSESEVSQKQNEFKTKCVELGFKATNTGNISIKPNGTQITGLDYEVDDKSENYAKQLLKGVEAAGGFLPAFGIVGTYDGILEPANKNSAGEAIIIDKGVGANEAYIDETNAQNAVTGKGFGTWAQFKTTNVVTVVAGGYVDKKENYVYGDSDTPIKKKPNGLVDWQNQSTFNITSANTYPFGDFNFVQTLKKQLISIQREKAAANPNIGIGKDFDLIYGDENSNPTYYIGPLTCHDCILKNYYATFGYNGMPESVKNSEKFITNRLNKLFNDFSKTINSSFSGYNNKINESYKDIFSRMQNKEQPVFTDNIFDGLFIGASAAAEKLVKSSIDKLDQSSLPEEKDVFSLLVYWLNSKFPMDNIQFYENGKESKLTSIFFTDIVECFKYEVLDTLQKWGSAFNKKIGSFDLKVGQEAFNDLTCSPAGVLISSCYYQDNSALKFDAKNDESNATTVKENIMKVLNIMASANILEKIIIKNLDIASINKYVVYKLIELAEGAVSFVNPPAEEDVNDNVAASQIQSDLRQPARYFNKINSISLTDYNWGPVYNLEHTKIDPNSFSRLILWEFQPAAVTPTKVLVAAAEQLGANAVGKYIEKTTGTEKVAQGMKSSIPDKVKNFIGKNDKSVIAATRLAGSLAVNTELDSLMTDSKKEEKVLGVDWIKYKLPGKWVGRYEIPFFNNSFMKTKTKDSWSMGNNALSEAGNIVGAVRDGLQMNVQDVPVWDFNKDSQEGINWSTSFFLINDNIGNVKKNISFLMSFAAGSYWLQINGYQYHCPNLYRVECPGRFFELYTSLDIQVQYYGKTRKLLKSEAGKIFDENYKFKLFNELLKNNQLFIPEAYEIKIDSKSLQPNAFNIQYNYFINGASGNRPDGNVTETAGSEFSATKADNNYKNRTTDVENINNQLATDAGTLEKAKEAQQKKQQEAAKKQS